MVASLQLFLLQRIIVNMLNGKLKSLDRWPKVFNTSRLKVKII